MEQNLDKPNYQAWDIDFATFPMNGSHVEKLRFLSKFGVLAPSVHNTQPWVVDFGQDFMTIDRNPGVSLEHADNDNRWQWFAIGMFIENMVQAGHFYGYKIGAKGVDGKYKITVDVDEKADEQNISVLEAILARASDKRSYNGDSLNQATVDALKAIDTPKSVSMIYVSRDNPIFQSVLELYMNCVIGVANDQDFVRELAGWTRSNVTKSYDGMPGFVMGIPTLQSLVASKLLSKKPELFKKVVPKEKALLESSSGVVVVTTKAVDQDSMVTAGAYSERIWLEAIKQGLAIHPMTGLLNSDQYRRRLAKVLETESVPTFFMRVGKPQDDHALHSPRRLV